MLVYLDNLESMGPNSVAGINRDKSLNENLAREILELHTLGVRTGYSQDDVTRFANVLTGWTWIALGEPNRGGEFVFVKRFHEPGEQTVMGKAYPDTGVDQGRAVLADLARHPATAGTSRISSPGISSPTHLRPRWSPSWRGVLPIVTAI